MRCTQCGTESGRQAKFCAECGAPLATRTTSAASRAALAPAAAERRQITVLFCDLVGSTELSTRLDPEDLRDVVRAYQKTCATVVSRFDGHIAQYLGDGILVYFGYPRAHEDDAHRATRTGLGMVEAIQGLNRRLEEEYGVSVALRVGIHTGLVVAGEVGAAGATEDLAIGETPNVAARLQSLAEPNMVVIGAATHRLVGPFFDCRELGLHSFKGLAQPITAYAVLFESTAGSRLDTAPAGLLPLVGRDAEMDLLTERWQQARAGRGAITLLGAEAGIGKSRLVRALVEHVARDPTAWLTACQCSPYHQNTAFYPVIDLVERIVLRFSGDDTVEHKLHKVEGWLAQHGFSLPDVVPLFATLLSLPLGDRYAPLALSREAQRHRTMDALATIVLTRAEQQPVLFVIEDLHWTDPSTLELLDLIVERAPASPLLALFTYRPDFHPPWLERPAVEEVSLDRLSRIAAAAMIDRITGGRALPQQVQEQILIRTDGVPLFVEELTKSVLESRLLRPSNHHYELTGPLSPVEIPTTLRDALTARLDRLGTAKRVAQLSAVIGREFHLDLLRSVAQIDDASLEEDLTALVSAGMIYATGERPDATYVFRHVLIQEAAYESLLRRSRQEYHRRIAQVLIERFPDTIASQPELVARHFTQAGLGEQAIPYWTQAGERAIQRSANHEAISHLTTALDLLSSLPETPERLRQELALRVLIAVPLTLTRGWASPEVGEAYRRARELSELVGETPQHYPALVGELTYYLTRREMKAALEMCVRNWEIAERAQDPGLILEAEHVWGSALFYVGEIVECLPHLRRVEELYDPAQHRQHAFVYGKDPAMVALVFDALSLWCLGYPDQAAQKATAAVGITDPQFHPFSHIWALASRAFVHQMRGEVDIVLQVAQVVVDLSIEQSSPSWLSQGMCLLGWAVARQGRQDEGIDMMRQGLDRWRRTGSEGVLPYFLSLLVDGLAVSGRLAEAIDVLDEAFERMERTEEHWWEPELYRLRGRLSLEQAPDRAADAEASFQRALTIARQQHERSLELRAALGLARLWRERGQVEEARTLLEPVYRWFTEGFETQDLADARALLDLLSAAPLESS